MQCGFFISCKGTAEFFSRRTSNACFFSCNDLFMPFVFQLPLLSCLTGLVPVYACPDSMWLTQQRCATSWMISINFDHVQLMTYCSITKVPSFILIPFETAKKLRQKECYKSRSNILLWPYIVSTLNYAESCSGTRCAASDNKGKFFIFFIFFLGDFGDIDSIISGPDISAYFTRKSKKWMFQRKKMFIDSLKSRRSDVCGFSSIAMIQFS